MVILLLEVFENLGITNFGLAPTNIYQSLSEACQGKVMQSLMAQQSIYHNDPKFSDRGLDTISTGFAILPASFLILGITIWKNHLV